MYAIDALLSRALSKSELCDRVVLGFRGCTRCTTRNALKDEPSAKSRRADRMFGLELQGVVRTVLSAHAPTGQVAGVLCGTLRHGGDQQHVLQASRALDVRGLACPFAERLSRSDQGQPFPDTHEAASRSGRARRPALFAGRRARAEARPRAVSTAGQLHVRFIKA